MDGLDRMPRRDLARLRESYRRLNDSFPATFAFRFGRGAGFAAEMLGLLKGAMSCLHQRIRFALAEGGRSMGVAAFAGFHDYFEPIFPVERLGNINALNVSAMRGFGRFPPLRRGASALLRRQSGLDLFMMDDLALPPHRLVVPELAIDLDYWEACALLARMALVYRADVAEWVAGAVSEWTLPPSYIAVHLRRGDKVSEIPYANIDAYVRAIDGLRGGETAVAVASDDARAIDELRRRLEPRFEVLPCSDTEGRGFDRRRFNALPPEARFAATRRFLAELEMLRGGTSFVGQEGSNVSFLLAMMRAGQGVHRVR